MPTRGEPHAISGALNNRRSVLGLDLPVWLSVSMLCVGTFLLGLHKFALALFPLLAIGSWLLHRKHPHFLNVWLHSLTQRNYYDPRK